MRVPSGMIAGQPIALSVGQQNQHHIPEGIVTGTVLKEKGDGWVENTWANRHLSGSVIQKRRRGQGYRYEFVPLDNALVEVDQVDAQISGELERLAGGRDDTGLFEPGELDHLREAHTELSRWLTLTPEDKDEIAGVFGGIADARARATNPFNLTAGSIAHRARELKDRTGRYNPSAVMAMSLKLEKQLAARQGELTENVLVNHERGNRLNNQWLFHENQMVAGANAILERLRDSQSDDDLYVLKSMAPHIRFRVRPCNLLAHEIAETGGEVADEQVVVDVLAALQFERFKNYVATPFRQMTTQTRPDHCDVPTVTDDLSEAINQRLVALESMDAPGATGRLVGRLIPLGEQVVEAALHGDKKTAKTVGKAFMKLLQYHCDPAGDPETEVWYRHQIR